MKFNDFLKDIAKKGNIDLTNPDIAATLGASSLKEIEVPEVFISQFYSNFYTEDAAKNDPKLKGHFVKQAIGEAFTITDSSINQVFRGMGYGDDFIEELNKKSWDDDRGRIDTKKKIMNFGEEVKKILAEKKNDKGQAGEEARKMVEDLQKQIKAQEEKYKTDLEGLKEQNRVDKITSSLKNKIFSFNLLDMEESDKLDVANAKIAKILGQYHLEEGDNGGLEIRTKTDKMEVYDQQRNKLTIDSLLANELKSFVKKSDTQSATNNIGAGQTPFPVQQKATTLTDMARQQANKYAAEELARMKQAS